MAVNSVITSKDIRIFLMDKPDLNTLIDGVRWDEQDIEAAQIMCCDYYNSSPPITNSEQYTVDSFPYRYFMLMWTAGHLLKSAAINQASNQLSYSAAGVTIDDNNKAQLFAQMGSEMQAEAKELMKASKIAKNVMNAYGGKSSEWAWLVR